MSSDRSAPATGVEELPAGKDADAAGGRGFGGHFLVFDFDALPAQAAIDRGEQVLGDAAFR